MEPGSRYELLESLGSGTFATVYRARDVELNREVAIRQIHSQWLTDPKVLERYWAEAQLLASVQHPHIVTIYDIVRSKGWIVLELMQASLRQRLSGRPMDLRALRTTLIHALKALKYLHSRGIIHGDINPGNLMVDARKRVKVGDFGIARRLARTDGSVSRGTSRYMAPEALSGEVSQVGPGSDLYSLGFSCYELLCGDAFLDLFPGLNAEGPQAEATWMMWHAASDRKLPPISQVLEGVPADLAAVIEKLIQKSPKDRYQSADAVLAALGDENKSMDRESSEPARDESERTRRPRTGVIVMFTISCLISVGLLFLPTQKDTPAEVAEPRHGIVRNVDISASLLQFEDELTGVPEECPLPAKQKVRLILLGEPERFILPKEIQPGDWLKIRPATRPGEELLYVVSRPLKQEGVLTRIDAASGNIVIAIESGRLRDEVPLFVPERTVIKLNGQTSQLIHARVGDRVVVSHLLDPQGQKGHLVSQLDILRTEESTGFLVAVEPDGKTLILGDSAGKMGQRKVVLAPQAKLTLTTGRELAVADLIPGDRLVIQSDEFARSVVITRSEVAEHGLLLETREDGTCLMRSDSGNEILLTITDKTEIRLSRTPATLFELRPQIDRLDVTIRTEDSGERTALTIDATRAVKHDRWAIVIGNGTFEDSHLRPVTYTVPDAEACHRILVDRYCLDPQWGVLLSDRDANTVREEVSAFLAKVTQPMQLIVSVSGRGYLGADGRVYLALRDFQSEQFATSGLPLESLIDALERCPAQNKLLLLDLVHLDEGGGSNSVDLPKLLKTLKTPIKTLKIIGASSEGELSSAIGTSSRSWFSQMVERAFAGAADSDRDLSISFSELSSFLESSAANSSDPVTQHPLLWTDDEPVPTPTEAP